MHWFTGSPGIWLLLALAACGLASMGSLGMRWLRTARRPETPVPFSFLVLTRNQEHQIEGFLRALLGLLRQSPRVAGVCDIVLVDLASTDATPYILERLARTENLRLVRLESDQVATGLEMAQFLSRGQLSTVIDLRGEVDVPAVLRTLHMIW
jgi:hypothetical protein